MGRNYGSGPPRKRSTWGTVLEETSWRIGSHLTLLAGVFTDSEQVSLREAKAALDRARGEFARLDAEDAVSAKAEEATGK